MNIDEQRAAEAGLPWGGPARPDPPLHSFPMRSSFAAELSGYHFPAPEVSSREGREGEVLLPAPVFELSAYARYLGWDHMITYARGWVPHATRGTPSAGAARESWAVRMRRGGYRAVAVRMNGSWASMWTWSDQDRFTHHATLEAFKGAIQ